MALEKEKNMFRFIWLFLRAGNPVLRYTRLHEGWFLGALTGIGIYLTACLLALYANIAGGQLLNFVLAGIFQVVAFLLLFMPGNFIALAIIGFIGGQPGNTPGLSIDDGVRTARENMAWFANIAGSIIFYGSIPFLALAIFSFEEHGYAAIIMLSLAAPVAIGAGRIFPDSTFFIKLVYWIEVIVLVTALGLTLKNTYWKYVGSDQDRLVNQIEAAMQKQLDEPVKETLKEILRKAKKGTPLTKEEINLFKGYQAKKSEKSPVGILKQGGDVLQLVAEEAREVKATALKTWYGEEHPYSVTLSAEAPWKPLQVCRLPIGSYKISVRNTISAPITDTGGEDRGDFNLATTELKLGSQFGITVDGRRIGETVGVTSTEQCLQVSAAMFPEIRSMFIRGDLQLGSAPSTTLVLTR